MNNNRSSLSPSSFFFTDGVSNLVQTNADAFGPVLNSENASFRTTAKFAVTGAKPAYAICTGQVFLQPNSQDTSKVNLILRPYRQPINGIAIKYFVYRGLKKSDFIPSGNLLVAHNNLSTASGFINIVWEQLKKFNDWEDSEANSQNFPAAWIGYDPDNQASDTLVDDYFFAANIEGDENDEELKPFEFPVIKAGTHLGDFTGVCGVDVVLSDGDYKALSSDTGFTFDLEYARALENVIDINALPLNTTEKQYREAITHFMDPIAFYGLHVQGGEVFLPNGDNDPIKKEAIAIYDDLLTNFHTKNNAYIYIQSDLGRSFDYYKNYREVISTEETEVLEVLKVGAAEDTMQLTLPSTHGWPLLIHNETQTHTEEQNKLYLQFVVGNLTPLCYAQVGELQEEAENNFLIAEQLIPIQSEPVEGEEPVTNVYSQPVIINIPAKEGAGDNKQNVASFIKLLYQGADLTATGEENGEVVEYPIKTIDTLFNPIHIESRFATTTQNPEISWCVSHKNNLVDTTHIDEKNTAKMAMQTKIIYDKLAYSENEEALVQDRVIYETQALEGIGKGLLSRSNSLTSSTSSGSRPFSIEINNFYLLNLPYSYEVDLVSEENQTISGLNLLIDNKDSNLNKYILGLLSEEINFIHDIINQGNIKNTSFFLKPILFENGQNNNTYRKYTLGVLGERNSNDLEILNPTQEITIYSLDNHYFFTKKYSDHMSNIVLELTLDIEI